MDGRFRGPAGEPGEEPTWAVPESSIEPGETPEQAAVREVKEETGLDVRVMRPYAVVEGVEEHWAYWVHYFIQADFRDFSLPEPAQLIAIPYYTVVHLVTLEDKRAGLRRTYSQLAPGGHLILDHFVFDPQAAQRHQRVILRGEYTDAATGRDLLPWTTTRHDFEAQTMRVTAWTEELDDDGVVLCHKYRRLSFGWIEPEEMCALLEETGFDIGTLYGDFDFCSRNPASV